MKCINCNGEVFQYRLIYKEIRKNDKIVLIPSQVPICVKCGGRGCDPMNYQSLETIEKMYGPSISV